MNKAYNIIFSLVLITSLVIVALSCAPNSKLIETEADFIGFITEIQPGQNKDIIGQISLESHADKVVTKYVVTIKDETLIFQQDGDNLLKTAFKTLENKQWVKIWFSGPVMESWPMQATAQQIVIVEHATLLE
jgi:hypothetical protein